MTKTWFTTLESPLGELLLTGDGECLTGLYLPRQKHGHAVQPDWKRDAAQFRAVITQLSAYFASELRDFELPLRPQGSAFQQAVWQALRVIPFGATESYGALATRLGRPGAARAVGLANGRNPISIIVPCHRVIGADGSLTGYGGGIARKRWLLAHERDTGP